MYSSDQDYLDRRQHITQGRGRVRGTGYQRGRGHQGRGRAWGRGRGKDRATGSHTHGCNSGDGGSGTGDDNLQWYTTTLIHLIVDQTNLYASQVMDISQYEKWSKVTADEIWAYFGFMGINHLPALADYWKLDPTYRYSPIADKITWDRFVEITRYFHFVDNSTLPSRTDPGHDKLGNIRPVICHLSRQFLTHTARLPLTRL